jgi:hypothetical protein
MGASVAVGMLIDEHQPQRPTETMLVEAIAAARWRQDRIWGMQKVAFDHDVTSSPTTSTVPPLRAVLSLHNSADSVRTSAPPTPLRNLSRKLSRPRPDTRFERRPYRTNPAIH